MGRHLRHKRSRRVDLAVGHVSHPERSCRSGYCRYQRDLSDRNQTISRLV